jgi:hypothetical protein
MRVALKEALIHPQWHITVIIAENIAGNKARIKVDNCFPYQANNEDSVRSLIGNFFFTSLPATYSRKV